MNGEASSASNCELKQSNKKQNMFCAELHVHVQL